METPLTERARRVLDMAQEEGRRQGVPEIGTELLLLGLLRENEGIAAKILVGMGISLGAVRADIERGERNHAAPAREEFPPKIARDWLGRERGVNKIPPEIPTSLHFKLALELAGEESRRFHPELGRGFIGTEHLLLGLLSEVDGGAARIFGRLGLDVETTRTLVMEYFPAQ